MIVIRPVEYTDIDSLYNLAKRVGPGMTTFPADREVLLQKIARSEIAFSVSVIKEQSNSFLMVLEDTDTNAVMGTAGVYSNIGKDVPFYTFQILSRNKYSYGLKSKVSSKTLHLVNEYTGDTEVGTLIIDPDYRGGGYGKLLSKCRYLLIAQFQSLFGARLIAELRGWSDENSISPFWEHVGKHFFEGMSYDHADFLSATTNNQFIADLMPEYPIYIDLLPKQAQTVIGKPNKMGEPALQMLFDEGFRYENFVDIFDAGPTVHAYVENIKTVIDSHEKILDYISEDDEKNGVSCLVCNTSLENFRVTRAKVNYLATGNISIAKPVADTLLVKWGDKIRIYLLS
ncbi:MAG: arginine N-succinyltransferase [Colwellia sp.]|nr:arginine N-succinyltransferase [Colwellia sp.]